MQNVWRKRGSNARLNNKFSSSSNSKNDEDCSSDKISVFSAEKHNDVRTQQHDSEARGNTIFLHQYLHHPIMKLVFVPFISPINFNRVLSEMLLNCILFSFTRKMETNWLSACLVNFP